MILEKNEDLKKIKLLKNKKINILNIENEYKIIKEKSKEININDFIENINFYIEKEKEKEIIKNLFKNYKYYRYSIYHIIENEKEIIILRNNNERKFFQENHIKYFLNERKENENIKDFENRKDEIIIYKNYIIFDYKKYDYK